MVFYDRATRVVMNDHGGLTLHFDGFQISNTIGGEWCMSRPEGNRWVEQTYHKSIMEAFWAGMKWPENVPPDQFIIEPPCQPTRSSRRTNKACRRP